MLFNLHDTNISTNSVDRARSSADAGEPYHGNFAGELIALLLKDSGGCGASAGARSRSHPGDLVLIDASEGRWCSVAGAAAIRQHGVR